MSRQSITFTQPNDAWLKQQVDSQEYKTKSEVVNDLIRKARARQQVEITAIRAALLEADHSGFTIQTLEEIKAEAQKELRDGCEL